MQAGPRGQAHQRRAGKEALDHRLSASRAWPVREADPLRAAIPPPRACGAGERHQQDRRPELGERTASKPALTGG
jgi:hypothetical protein